MARDQPAALVPSQAVYQAFDSMIRGIPWAIAPRYGLRPGSSWAFDWVSLTTWESVFATAYPSPGKCFIVASSPAVAMPPAKASATDVVVAALNDQVRPCW